MHIHTHIHTHIYLYMYWYIYISYIIYHISYTQIHECVLPFQCNVDCRWFIVLNCWIGFVYGTHSFFVYAQPLSLDTGAMWLQISPIRKKQHRIDPLNTYMKSMTRFWNLSPTKKTYSEFQKCIYRTCFYVFFYQPHSHRIHGTGIFTY